MLIYGPDSLRGCLKRYIQNQKDLGSNSNIVTRLLVTLGSSGGQIVSKVSHEVVNSLVNRFVWVNYYKGETVCCLIIVVLFMGPGGAYRLGRGRFLNHHIVGQVTKDWDHFYEGS